MPIIPVTKLIAYGELFEGMSVLTFKLHLGVNSREYVLQRWYIDPINHWKDEEISEEKANDYYNLLIPARRFDGADFS